MENIYTALFYIGFEFFGLRYGRSFQINICPVKIPNVKPSGQQKRECHQTNDEISFCKRFFWLHNASLIIAFGIILMVLIEVDTLPLRLWHLSRHLERKADQLDRPASLDTLML